MADWHSPTVLAVVGGCWKLTDLLPTAAVDIRSARLSRFVSIGALTRILAEKRFVLIARLSSAQSAGLITFGQAR